MIDKKDIIEEIIHREFKMFQQVNNISMRAPCQDNRQTFYIMRFSQWEAFSKETIDSYLEDLKIAEEENRNLIMEKYGYMMEYTDPAYYKTTLAKHLPEISPEKDSLILKIVDILSENQEKFQREYPKFSQQGRTVDESSGKTSIRIYNIGELKTFSIKTLNLYFNDVIRAHRMGRGLIYKIYEKTADFYGYKSLEEVEKSLK